MRVQNWLNHRKCTIFIEKCVHGSNIQDLNFPSQCNMKVLLAHSLFISVLSVSEKLLSNCLLCQVYYVLNSSEIFVFSGDSVIIDNMLTFLWYFNGLRITNENHEQVWRIGAYAVTQALRIKRFSAIEPEIFHQGLQQ